ncbi:MocR-like pyridoxine biosynthesis transcription factor PdxR [Gordonia aquimaris]|uniref:PLP-dependent aminotransferase family protein n=1 Tax=Gordonia aquimaris TaxID=2984863 RepID=A0A9X3D357_9ACTN|nr:PLP-dependent aminotransferase family protein [Gordonia aquimaris]MCX2962557.1 PLP-dependent aminotransferase family protein [Gordonia aquimaris]
MDKSVNPDPWERIAQHLGVDLYLDLQPDPAGSTRGRGARRRHSLASALREAISDGRLGPGTLLPPYRSLAADVGLARGTVAAVYQELIAEGWLVARQGSGTRVADTPRPGVSAPTRSVRQTPTTDHDFGLGQPNPSLFPRADWIAATRRALTDAPDRTFGPGDPQGSERLRNSLAGYLARARGVRTDPAHIVLTTSVLRALELLSRNVFGDVLAVESHGLPFHRAAVERGGTATMPVPVDGDGAAVDRLSDEASAVLLTPSHQYPTGVPLSPSRRARVIEWAGDHDALVVEDDYDGELRYDREPVGALQALNPDVVIYTGSVSKSISPAVRIAWLVLPPRLVEVVRATKGLREPDASIIDQLVLAELIDSGAYDRHIRRSRQYYRRRRDVLTDAFAHAGVTIPGIAAGLHAVIPLPSRDEDTVFDAALRRRFALAKMSQFRHPDTSIDDSSPSGLVVGFGTPPASSYQADVRALVSLVTERV